MKAVIAEFERKLKEADDYGILAEDMGLTDADMPDDPEQKISFIKAESAKIINYLKEDADDANYRDPDMKALDLGLGNLTLDQDMEDLTNLFGKLSLDHPKDADTSPLPDGPDHSSALLEE